MMNAHTMKRFATVFPACLCVLSLVGCTHTSTPVANTTPTVAAPAPQVQPVFSTPAPAAVAPSTHVWPTFSAPVSTRTPAAPPPATYELAGLTVTPAVSAPGTTYVITVTLSSPAPSGGVSVDFTIADVVTGDTTEKSPIFIPAGATSATASFTADTDDKYTFYCHCGDRAPLLGATITPQGDDRRWAKGTVDDTNNSVVGTEVEL